MTQFFYAFLYQGAGKQPDLVFVSMSTTTKKENLRIVERLFCDNIIIDSIKFEGWSFDAIRIAIGKCKCFDITNPRTFPFCDFHIQLHVN